MMRWVPALLILWAATWYATHMFDFASSFALAGGFEDAQSHLLQVVKKSGLDSMTF